MMLDVFGTFLALRRYRLIPHAAAGYICRLVDIHLLGVPIDGSGVWHLGNPAAVEPDHPPEVSHQGIPITAGPGLVSLRDMVYKVFIRNLSYYFLESITLN